MNFEEMYKDYVKSYLNAEVVITEWGFVQYQEMKDNFIVVNNLYLEPKYRNGGELGDDHPGVKSMKQVIASAKEKGFKGLLNIVEKSNPKRERLIKYHEKFGLRLWKEAPNGDIYMIMEF